jgi:hypothetical protein
MDDLIKSAPANILPSGGEHSSAVAETTNKPAELRPTIDDIISSKRFVRFEETEDPDEMAPNGHARSSSTLRKQSTTAMLRLLVEKKQNAEPFEWFEADGIAINPKESLQLRQIDDERDPIDLFVIKNTGNNGLLFKIKTTSPEKFRVRPSVGFIPPHESDYVRIQLQNEYRPTLKAERFLFMGIRTNNENIENFGTLWKESPTQYKIEKTFNCNMATSESITLPSSDTFRQREPSIHSINNENTELRRKITELGQRQMIIIFMLLFLLIVHFLFVVQLRSSIDNLTDAITQTQHNTHIKSKRSDL